MRSLGLDLNDMSRSGSAGSNLLGGAAAGGLATIAMSAAMLGFKRLGMMGELPPEKITARALDRLGIHRSRAAQDLLASANHIAFGAGGGAIFVALRRWAPATIATLPLGLVFASAIWAVSYGGWAPALGLMPPPQRDRVGRPTAMITAHFVYGAVLAFLVDRFIERSHRPAVEAFVSLSQTRRTSPIETGREPMQ